MKRKILAVLIGMSLIVLASGCGTSDTDGGNLVISKDVEFDVWDYEKIVSPNNELGFELLDEISPDDDGNLFISPTSLMMALAMVYNGADGEMKDEISYALQMKGIDPMELNEANASLMTMLNKDTDAIQLRVANSIWLNDQFTFQDEFAGRAKDYFNAEINEIDITSKESPKRINEWVKDATNGKIDKMAEDPLDEDLVALLLNAIYFKGDWQHPFIKKDTEERAFHLNDGEEIEVPFMKLQEKLAYNSTDAYEAIQLPYANGEMSMTIVLPNEVASVKDLHSALSNDKWEEISSGMTFQKGTILLPKFKLSYETELNDALEALGMKGAFKEGANFSKMVEDDKSLLISEVKQKTYIDVNEEGTEAAAATGVAVDAASAPPDAPFIMDVNRPFFIAITDDETGTILFLGSIANPTTK